MAHFANAGQKTAFSSVVSAANASEFVFTSGETRLFLLSVGYLLGVLNTDCPICQKVVALYRCGRACQHDRYLPGRLGVLLAWHCLSFRSHQGLVALVERFHALRKRVLVQHGV